MTLKALTRAYLAALEAESAIARAIKRTSDPVVVAGLARDLELRHAETERALRLVVRKVRDLA